MTHSFIFINHNYQFAHFIYYSWNETISPEFVKFMVHFIRKRNLFHLENVKFVKLLGYSVFSAISEALRRGNECVQSSLCFISFSVPLLPTFKR